MRRSPTLVLTMTNGDAAQVTIQALTTEALLWASFMAALGDPMKKRFALVPMMIVAVMCVLLLSACGGVSAEDAIRADLESYLGDQDSAAEEFASGLEEAAGDDLELLGITEDEFTEAYLDGFSYSIGDIAVDDDTATAKVTVTIKSMSDIMKAFNSSFTDWASDVDSSMSEDDFYKQGGKMLLEATRNAEAKENTYDFVYTRNDDGEWEMDEDSAADFVNAAIA